jgi:hypothetical protein
MIFLKNLLSKHNIITNTIFATLYLLFLYIIFTVGFSIKKPDLIIFNPFLPLILHSALTFFRLNTVFQTIEDRIYPVLNQNMNTNLILAGFCFTSLSFLFTLFKVDITIYKHTFLFFILALGFFLTSYFSLHFKIANLFSYLSKASTDSGLWCILLGFFHLFKVWKELEAINLAISVLIIVFICYLIFDFILTIIGEKMEKGGN